MIDGVESSKLELSRIQVEDIESFSVLKDASATAMYGARGANGVIKVTTKKGEEGSVYTNFRYESVLTQPTSTIDVVDPITYMRMYDQAQLGRNPNATPQYSVDYINKPASGKYPSWLYPHTDWYKQLFKDFAWNHGAGVNIRGGSKKVQYYAAINYNRDEGMIKTDKLNDFDCNIVNNQDAVPHQLEHRSALRHQIGHQLRSHIGQVPWSTNQPDRGLLLRIQCLTCGLCSYLSSR